jgi:hypothetical protein
LCLTARRRPTTTAHLRLRAAASGSGLRRRWGARAARWRTALTWRRRRW